MALLPNAIKVETKFLQLHIFRESGNVQSFADDPHTITPFHIICPPSKTLKPTLYNPMRFGPGNGGLLNMATKELDSALIPLDSVSCLLAFALGFGSGSMRFLLEPHILSHWRSMSNQIIQQALAMYMYENSQAKDIKQTLVYIYLQVSLLYASSTGNEIKFLTGLQLKRYAMNIKYYDNRFSYSCTVFALPLICGNRSAYLRQYDPRVLIEFEETVELLHPFVKKNNVHFMELKNFLSFLQDIIDFKHGNVIPDTYLFNFETIHRIAKVWYHIFPSRCNSATLLAGVNHLDRAVCGLFIALAKILNHVLPSICHMMFHSFDGEMSYWYDEKPLYKALTQGTEFDDSFYFLETLREINQYSARISVFFNTRWNMYTYLTLMFRAKNNEIVYPRQTAGNVNEVMITRFRNSVISSVNMIHIPALVQAPFILGPNLDISSYEAQLYKSRYPHTKVENFAYPGFGNDGIDKVNLSDMNSQQILGEQIDIAAQIAVGLDKWNYWIKKLYVDYKRILLSYNLNNRVFAASPEVMVDIDNAFIRSTEERLFNEDTGLFEDDFDGLFIYSHCKYIVECEITAQEMIVSLRELLQLRELYVG